MDDNSSRRSSREGFNPFSFSSFIKQHSDNEELPSPYTEQNSPPVQNNGESDDNSNPYSIKNFAKIKAEKMFPKLPTVSTDSEDECNTSNTSPVETLDNTPETILTKRPLLIIEDTPNNLQALPSVDFDFTPNNEAFETLVFSDDDTIDDVTTDDLQEVHLKNKLHISNSEVTRLQEQLKETEKLVGEKERRIAELEMELKKVKLREAEETATLERMMHSIEKNLQLTTERAVNAETQVSRLKQENKVLQAQTVALEEQLMIGPREVEVEAKALSISHKLNLAANQAEASLKDLLEGVGQLRLLSSVMGNITKVSEAS